MHPLLFASHPSPDVGNIRTRPAVRPALLHSISTHARPTRHCIGLWRPRLSCVGPAPCGPSHRCLETLLELLLRSGIWGWDGRKVITMMTHGIAVWGIREKEQGRRLKHRAKIIGSKDRQEQSRKHHKGTVMSEHREIERNLSQIWMHNSKHHTEKWRVREDFWRVWAR